MRLASALLVLVLLALPASYPILLGDGGGGVVTRSCTVHIVAVSSSGGGVVGNLTVTIAYPGGGRVYISTSPASMVDTQGSARLAAFAASLLAGVDMSKIDFYYDLEAESIIVGGPSAGAAMALATLALLEGVECPSWVVATGMIQPDTSIGPVGGLKEKLEAAASAGARMFIIPAGQEVYTYYETVERRIGPFVYVEREPVTVNLTQLGEELGVRVYAAPTLASAFQAVYEESLARGGSRLPGIPPWMISRISGFIDYASGAVSTASAKAVGSVASELVAAANESVAEAKRLYRSGSYYEAALSAVDALTAAREAEILAWAASYGLDVTRYVGLVNETLIKLWGEAEQASASAAGLEQVEALAYAFAELAIAARHYQDALSSLESSGGSYKLPAGILGVDLTGARLLANAWSTAEWAWFWLNASRDAPRDPPVDPQALREAAGLLEAQAKSTAAYLRTLLEEAGGNPGAAGLAEYLAERAAAERDPVAVIGLAVESISASTATIHREFTLRTAETAGELAGLAASIAASGPGGLQSGLLLNLASTADDTQTAIAAASKAVLYAWLERQLTNAAQTPPPANTTPAETSQPPTATTTSNKGSPPATPGGETPTATQTQPSTTATTMIAAVAGVGGFLLGLLAGEATRKSRGRP